MKKIIIKHAIFSKKIGDWKKTDTINTNVFSVPVLGVSLDFDMIVETPRFQLERAVANEILGLCPLGKAFTYAAVIEDNVLRNRKPCVMLCYFREKW